MRRAFYVGQFPAQVEIAFARGGPTRESPVAPEVAAWRVREWFPDDATGRHLLADVLAELGEPRVAGPFSSLDLARDRVAQALRHGTLVAHPIAEKLAGSPIEKAIEVETRQQDDKHFVEFVFEYPDGSPVKGVEYKLIFPDGKTEDGKLGGDGIIAKEDVQKGAYVVVMKEVESVRWARSRARCDDEVKILASVSGFAPGDAAKIKVYREHKEEPGDEVATLDGSVKDDKIEATFKYDYKKDDARKREEGVARFVAEVSLDGGKHWAKTPSALEVELKTIRAAAWSKSYAYDGQTVELGVDVLGFADGTAAKLDVHRFHELGDADDKVKTLDVQITGGKVKGACAYATDGGDITREGEYYFEVTIDDGVERKARSALLWCTDVV